MSLSLSPSLSLAPCAESLAKPTISVSPGVVPEHKEKVTFQCDTKDINPTISWVFSHRLLVSHEHTQLSPDTSELTISPVLQGHAGRYQCEASDGQRSQSSDPTYLVVNRESLSVSPNPLLTPTSLVFSFSHIASNTHPNADLSALELQMLNGLVSLLGVYQQNLT